MIKSKIEARYRALELAIKQNETRNVISVCADDLALGKATISRAKMFEAYLIGDAELPETEPSVEDVTNKAIERIFSAYGLNAGEQPKSNANALDGYPIGGIVPQSEQ